MVVFDERGGREGGREGTPGLFIARARFAIVPSILMHN